MAGCAARVADAVAAPRREQRKECTRVAAREAAGGAGDPGLGIAVAPSPRVGAGLRRGSEIVLRVGAVFVLHVVLYGALLRAGVAAGELPDSTEPWRLPASLALLALLNSCLFSYLVLRARGAGSTLGGILGLAFYGGHSVLQQLDGVAFPHVAPPVTLMALPFALNAVFTLLFVPLALALLRMEDMETSPRVTSASGRSPWALTWRIALALALHQLLFVAAGYWIARESLHTPDASAMLAELRRVLLTTPWLPGLQLVRGLLWVAISAPLIWALRTSRWESSLALGAFSAVVSSGELGFLSSHSLDFVARTHLAVFVLANFLAGAGLGALLSMGAAHSIPPGVRQITVNRW
jgi:hypothetical protein